MLIAPVVDDLGKSMSLYEAVNDMQDLIQSLESRGIKPLGFLSIYLDALRKGEDIDNHFILKKYHDEKQAYVNSFLSKIEQIERLTSQTEEFDSRIFAFVNLTYQDLLDGNY